MPHRRRSSRPGSGRRGSPAPAATRPCGRARRSGSPRVLPAARARPRRTSRRAAGRCRTPASVRRSCWPARRSSGSGARVDAHQVPGDLQVVPDDRPVLLPAPGLVVAPVLVELLLHERAVVVVREVLLDGVGDRHEHVGVLVVAGGEPGVDQVGRRVVADRVPVLARPVAAEGVALAVERDRVDVREVAAVLGVVEEPLEELDRQVDVFLDPRVAGDPEHLGRAGQRVDLLVGRDRVVVVAELRGEDLLLARLVDRRWRGTSRTTPSLLSSMRRCSRRYSVPFSAASRKRSSPVIRYALDEAVDEARDRVGLLAVADLVAGHVDADPVLAQVDSPSPNCGGSRSRPAGGPA